jgi:hypothetical protein
MLFESIEKDILLTSHGIPERDMMSFILRSVFQLLKDVDLLG